MAVRMVLGIVGAVLAPVLWKEDFLWVVLLRPTKEVLLTAGFLVKAGRMSLAPVVLASLPLLLGGVWLLYGLGRAWDDEAMGASGKPKTVVARLAHHLLPAHRIRRLTKVMGKRGEWLVFLGRLALFPSSLVAAAAGRSGMPARRFLTYDGLGGLASLVEIVGAGYLLGRAYEDAGPWVTAAGIAALVATAALLGRKLQTE